MHMSLRQNTRSLIAGLVGLVLMTTTAQAAPLSKADDGISDEFEFIAAPYLMFANLSGDFAIGQVGGPIDVGFGTIFDNLDFAFAADLEARKGRWGVVVNGQYMKLSASSDIQTPGPILQPILDASMAMFLLDSFVTWRTPLEAGWVDVFAGIRYTDFKTTLEFDPGLPLNPGLGAMHRVHPTWVSPIIGVRAAINLSEKWYVLLRGDIGGFGAGSDFTWSFNGGFGYSVSKSFDITLTFRYINDDYEEGTEGMPDYFEWDMETYGGQLGLVFHW